MDPGAVARLRSAASSDLTGPDGLPMTVSLLPGLDDGELAGLRSRYPVPLPAELVGVLAVTRGAPALLDLDLTGSAHQVDSPLLPAALPIASDGAGNVWALDLTPDTTDSAPVFYLAHDPPVLLYQAPDLAGFVDQLVAWFVPPHRSALADVRQDLRYAVWRSTPGAVAQPEAARSSDVALREFARMLSPSWTVVDLRHREVGMGVAWGRFGPQTRVARHGWERIFGYAPDEKPQRSWRRMWRTERT